MDFITLFTINVEMSSAGEANSAVGKPRLIIKNNEERKDVQEEKKSKPRFIIKDEKEKSEVKNEDEVLIACAPKWRKFAIELPLKKNGQVDNKKLRERAGSDKLKDCRPDLYEQIDKEAYKGEKKLELLTFGFNEKIYWICNCGKRWTACIKHRVRFRHSICPKCSCKMVGKCITIKEQEAKDRM